MGLAQNLVRASSLLREGTCTPFRSPSCSGIPGLGFGVGHVHELYAATVEDASAAVGFAAIVTGQLAAQRPILWLRSRRTATQSGIIQANGLADLGLAPAICLFGAIADNMALLRAGVDALRCAALGAVVIEGWGRMPELDLTASRRFFLASEKSGVPLFLLRMDAKPMPSAAHIRCQVAAAPSIALPGQAPGYPNFDIKLLRQRAGASGARWRLEWDRDRRKFRETPLFGAVVSVPVRRSNADTGTRPLRAA